MNKNEYNKLSLDKQLEFINAELTKGESLRNISFNLGLSKTTIRDRFKKINYEFDKDLRQYILVVGEEKYKTTTKVLTEDSETKKLIKDENYKDNSLVLKEENRTSQLNIKENKIPESIENKENYKNSGLVLNNKIKAELIELIKMKADIKVLIEEHKKSENIIELPELKIDTTVLNGEAVNRSLKMYSKVYTELQELYEIYPQFNKYDIISQAIHEFYLKYKK